MSQKHVLMIVENLPVPFDRRVWQHACALRDAGYAVSIISPKMRGYTKSYEETEGIAIYRHHLLLEANSGFLSYLGEWGSALLMQLFLAARIFSKKRFHIIDACNPPDLAFLVTLVFKPFGVKFVFDHHDVCPELYEARQGKQGVFHTVLLWLEKMTFKTADVVISTNETFRKLAIARGGKAAEDVFVVYSLLDTTKFYRVDPDPNLKKGKSLAIGYIGIMGPQDGLDLLLKAVKHLVEDLGQTDFHTLIVGDGTELVHLKALAVDLGITNYVTFTGYLEGEILLEALSTFDIGVIPDPVNVYTDKVAMNKVFEYMTLGIPFVQFNLTEGRNLSGDACVYAERDNDPLSLAESLKILIHQPELRERLSKIGLERVATHLMWDTEQKQLLAAYERALQAKRDYPGSTPDPIVE
jgi:glycosyltransferase involved in cell wall biosynthesis